jgi:hypothetical protein
MSLFTSARSPITRQTIKPDDGFVDHSDNSKIADIVQLLDGGGTELVRNKVLQRFAQKITRSDPDIAILSNSLGDAVAYEAKLNEAKAAAIAAGLHTVVSTMLFNRIVEIRASLFGAGDLFAYPDGDAFADDLSEARGQASHNQNMGRMDVLSTGIGASGCLIQADPIGYSYQPFDPTKVWAVFAEAIEVDNNRARVDVTNIEHASIWVMDVTGQKADQTKRDYVAYFARQTDYPNGRLVKYKSEEWDQIPDPGDGGHDWTNADEWSEMPASDQLANPLTLYQNSNTDSLYEYPVMRWHMDSTGFGTSLFPITGTALYDQVFELDVEMSRVMESAGRSAAGVFALLNESNTKILGAFNEGMVSLNRGQALSLLSHPASNAKDALAVINQVAEKTAARYHIPAYMVTSAENFQIPSGIALQMMNLPLLWDRESRTELNRSSMTRKFEIEKSLANFVQDSAVIPLDATEVWEPAPLEFPQDEANLATLATWQKHLLDNNLETVESLLVEMGKVETREAAEKMVEENTESNKARAPEPAPEPAQNRGGRLGAALNRGQQ